MKIFSIPRRMANAAVVFVRRRGLISDHARETGQSREKITTLEEQLKQATVIDDDRIAEFASMAQAEGVSLPVTRRLLGVFCAKRHHRWPRSDGAATNVRPVGGDSRQPSQHAAEKSAALLEVIDQAAAAKIQQAALDEIFVGRKPILMGVEPESFCWFQGTLSETRDGQAWSAVFDGLPTLEYAVNDAGSGLIKGLELTNQTRAATNSTCLHGDIRLNSNEDSTLSKVTHSLDIFHTQREGHRAWRVVESRLWKLHDQAEKAWKPLERQRSDVPARSVAQETLRRAGLSLQGQTGKAHQLRRDAEAALEAAVEIEAAWERAQATLELFTPDGWLNTRKAEAQRDEAVAKLSDACWKKTVSLLHRPQTYAFLDVLAARLEALPLSEGAKRDAIRFEGLRRRRAYLEQEDAAPVRGWLLLANLRYQRDETFAEAVESVRQVLRSVWRASSLVEGINSVVRMQQARHRCLTQSTTTLTE